MSKKGYKQTEEHRRKLGIAHLGKFLTKDHKEKIGRKSRGFTYKEIYGDRAEKEKKKRKEGNKGKHIEFWRKLGLANKGKKRSEEFRIRRSFCYSGKGNPNWQGGIGSLLYSFEFNEEFKTLIRERDNNTCQLCGKTREQEGKNLCVHHIYYDKMNECTNENDFITLCRSCNIKVNRNREYWTEFFQLKLEVIYSV